MSNTYDDIADNVDDGFDFVLRGNKYFMKYPITSEVEEIQALGVKIEEAQSENKQEEVKELNAKLESYLYELITPVEHDLPIKEALQSENIRVMRNFNRMIKTELSIQ